MSGVKQTSRGSGGWNPVFFFCYDNDSLKQGLWLICNHLPEAIHDPGFMHDALSTQALRPVDDFGVSRPAYRTEASNLL